MDIRPGGERGGLNARRGRGDHAKLLVQATIRGAGTVPEVVRRRWESMRKCSFRQPAGGAALGIALLWLLGAGANAAAAATDRAITVATWGGAYEYSQVKAYFEPFTKETGIRIDIERYNGGLAELRRQVIGGDVAWDLVDMTMADNRAACKQDCSSPSTHGAPPRVRRHAGPIRTSSTARLPSAGSRRSSMPW